MRTISTYPLKGKTAFVRVDLNCPVDEKTLAVEKSERISAHAKTIDAISKKGAKVVVLAHQGRKGDYDCISLSQHAALLEKELKKEVKFVDDVCGTKAREAIASLKEGEILLLENVRFLDDETKYKTIEENEQAAIVQNLSPLCDVFVLDAFSAAHRAHASIVGFHKKPVVAGLVMQRELEALGKVKNPKRPSVFVFGGAKADDSIGILARMLEEGKLDFALTCGVLGELFILASGRELGEPTLSFFKENNIIQYLPQARQMLEKYKEHIVFPSDVAVDSGGKRLEVELDSLPSKFMICDIGKKTAQKYAGLLLKAKTIMMNGPAGMYEKAGFEYGTKAILEAVEKSKAFSVMGGGHTLSALDRFRISKKKIGYISLAGKAFIEYLSGQELPGVKILS